MLLLSLAWGLSVILGRCDLSDTTGRAQDKKLTRGWDLNATGVSTDDGEPGHQPSILGDSESLHHTNAGRP